MISLRFYRIYDIGREIDIDWLEKSLARNYFTARTSFVRVKPKSIMIESSPLLIRMLPVTVEREGRSVPVFRCRPCLRYRCDQPLFHL